jgi:hypothetical protein
MLGMHSQRVVLVFLLAAVLSAPVDAGQAQDAAAKGAAILAEARKALGGDDKLAAIKAVQARGTVRRAAGEINLEGDLDLSIELPGKYLRKESIILGGGGQGLDRVEGLNGTEAWEEIKFGGGVNFGDGGDGGDFRGNRGGGQPAGQAAARPGQTPADPEQAKQQMLIMRQTEVTRVLLAMLLTTDQPVRWIGTAVTPQATAEVLEIRTADGTPTRIMIDSKTSMPLMLQWTGIAQDPLAALAGRAGFGRRGGRGGRGGFGGFPGGGRQGGAQARGSAPADTGLVRADALAQPTALQMFLSEYKTVNGVKLPHLMIRGAGDQVTEEWIIKNYRINPPFKPETFSK